MIFQAPVLNPEETRVIERISEIKGKLRYPLTAPPRWYGLLRRSTQARAIRGSNAIEGYNVTIEDAIAAEEELEPVEAEASSWSAVTGYRRAMTYVLRLASDPHFAYSPDLLRSLHYMMLEHDLSKNPGQWRPGYIAIRNEESGEIVYEGAEAGDVPALMRELVDALNADDINLPWMIQAAMAHLNLTMIHPFKDGNGRMARCLQTLVLARGGTLAPTFSSIEEYLGRNTPEYYDVLAEVGGGSWNPRRDARPWIRFCLTAHFRQASTIAQRIRQMQETWNALEIAIEKDGMPDRTILALADAATGYRVRNSTYRKVADISNNLASRDLKLLVDRELLSPQGEKRGRYYVASDKLKAICLKIEKPKPVGDPFDEPAPYLPGMEPDP